jgi:hypothetical protein
MATTPDMSSSTSTAQKSVNTFTKFMNLASASVSMLNEPPQIPKKAPPPELYISDKTCSLRVDDDVTDLPNQADLFQVLQELPEREIDLVFAGRTALDLSFQIPNGPFNDLQAMIETELEFRSPIQRDQSVWFWSAQETENGDWLVEGAIVLKTSVEWVLEALKTTGKTINLARRHREDGSLRLAVEPDWMKKTSILAKASGPFARLANIPPPLRLPIAAFAIFLVSVVSLYVAQAVRYNAVASEAQQSSDELRQLAAAQAITSSLIERRSMGEARVAALGTLAATLPDGVWLEQLIIDDEDVTIIGFAPSAAEVTRLLAALPALIDIEFGSPVTRDNTQNLERFRINAKLSGEL